jgi:hypothetical protein
MMKKTAFIVAAAVSSILTVGSVSAEPQAATPVNISNSSTDSSFDTAGSGSVHSLGVDQNGKAYVIWYEWLNPRRFYFATNKGGSWSKPVEIERLNWEHPESGFPVTAVSPSGNVHLMFHDGRDQMIDADIFHLTYNGSGWSATTNASGVATGPSVYGGVAVSPVDGTALVVWGENRADVAGEWLLVQRTRSASGAWSNVQVINQYSPNIIWGYFPRLAIDARGTAHMVYGYAHTSTIWYTKNATPTNPAGWTTPVRLRDTGFDWSYYSISCDNAGNAYVVWDDATTGNEEIFVNRIAADGTIGMPVNVSKSPAAVSSEPTLGVNPSTGDILVAWTENGNIYVNARLNGTWTGPGNATNSSVPCMQPCVAVDPSGGSHLVYAKQVGGNWEIMYSSLSGGISVVSPNGGESWQAGSTHDITWLSSGVSGNVKIDYSANGGQSWTAVSASTGNTGKFSWSVPAVASSSCLVRVSSLDGKSSDASDAAFTIAPVGTARIVLSRTVLTFGASSAGATTSSQSVAVSNGLTGSMNWTAASDRTWLSVSPASGSSAGKLTISVNPSGLGAGANTGSIRVASLEASNSPLTIAVTLNVAAAGGGGGPFGSFDSPLAGATVASSIPVTGWALDDVEVSSVKIYRTAAAGEASSPPGLVFIGDAVFIEGARPDVEQSYQAVPLNYRGGWGYMLLTHFLANKGNGAVTLVAVATDKEGGSTELGRKTVTCNNAAAVKPFGAIDTPAQGGTASGSAFVNFGWALTPLPSMIPTDGSTITVYIDGAAVGHPTYNQYRSDIAGNFPGYLNSGGAVGYFHLDTTKYSNGVHTIAWVATDNGGNSDGIGSRFFSVLNASGSPAASATGFAFQSAASLDAVPSAPLPLLVRKGYGRLPAAAVYPDARGAFEVAVRETDRIEIGLDRRFGDGRAAYRGYLLFGGALRPLPPGSVLDPVGGTFVWQPGPGFRGNFDLVFLAERDGRIESKTAVRVRIVSY